MVFTDNIDNRQDTMKNPPLYQLPKHQHQSLQRVYMEAIYF